MEAQTGRYRLGLASNLTAKRGCLEEMTPFQPLNYNKSLCALRNTHFNTPNGLLLRPSIFFSPSRVTSDTCFHYEAAFKTKKKQDDWVDGRGSRIVSFTHRSYYYEVKRQSAEVTSLYCSLKLENNTFNTQNVTVRVFLQRIPLQARIISLWRS